MSRITLLTACLVLVITSIAVAQDSFESTETAQLEGHVDAIFESLGTGSYATLRAVDELFSIYDVGLDRTPLRATGPEWNARLDELETQLAATGASVRYELSNRVCHATATVGYCAVEYQVTSNLGDITQTSQWQMTIVARLVEGSWMLVHLHNSPG